jgi:hypothetical protein
VSLVVTILSPKRHHSVALLSLFHALSCFFVALLRGGRFRQQAAHFGLQGWIARNQRFLGQAVASKAANNALQGSCRGGRNAKNP